MRSCKAGIWALVFLVLAVWAVVVPQKNASAQTGRPGKPAPAPALNAQGERADEPRAAKLPLRHVVLYKSGVGFFEHQGRVRGDQTLQLDFTSGQLNDVLQSLTVLDLNGGRIARVSYNSEAPLSERFGTLRLPLDEKTDVSKFYGALRGARLEIRSGTSLLTGRLLSVERKTRVSGGTTLEVDLATLVSDSGEVHSIEITPAVTVRLAERDVTEEVSRYLSLLASVWQEDLRRMTITTAGPGEHELYISYISEVPIWKTTYRVVLPSKPGEEPLLQGWAIVDNTVGEDWNDVELSLVAGAPQSFIEQLSQPYYARRPVVPLPQSAQLTPQTHEGAMLGGLASVAGTVTDASGASVPGVAVQVFSSTGEVVASAISDNEGKYSVLDLPPDNYRIEFNKPGFEKLVVQSVGRGGGQAQTQDVRLQVGTAGETIAVQAAPSVTETESAESGGPTGRVGSGARLGSGRGVGRGSGSGGGLVYGVAGGILGGSIGAARGAMEAAAGGAELGDLFEYDLKDRVTIHKNESALVPIVQTHVAAEKVSVWNASLGSPRPLRAIWLTNSSPLTLDGGSFSLLENETFAGEGLTDSIKPGEKRLLSYAADLGVRVNTKAESNPQRVTHVRIDRGVMIQTSEVREETDYTARNDDTTPRTLLIEHPLRAGWRIAGDTPKPEETTSSVYRFRLTLEPKSTQILEVREAKPLETRYELTNLTDDQVLTFLRQKSINPAIETSFRKIIEQKNRVAALDAEVSWRESETREIYDDQQRLRENLKALKGSAEERALTQRYTQQLADQETRLETLQRESADFEAKRDQAQADLGKMIQTLSLDTAI